MPLVLLRLHGGVPDPDRHRACTRSSSRAGCGARRGTSCRCIALGLVFWIFSLSVLRASLHDWEWQFIDPSAVYGGSAWRKHGEFNNATLPELIQLQAVSMSKNFAEVVRNMSYHTENFSHWCQRSQPAEHRTIMNVGLTLVLFVGLGYLARPVLRPARLPAASPAGASRSCRRSSARSRPTGAWR